MESDPISGSYQIPTGGHPICTIHEKQDLYIFFDLVDFDGKTFEAITREWKTLKTRNQSPV